MQLDVVNGNNERIGAVKVSDEVFGGRVNADLIWESVVRENASERQGTHATKNRSAVSGSGRKPWKQKGTGRARVGDIRNPLWRKGGTVFGPQPRSYDYQLPKKVERGALRAALAEKLQAGQVVVVETLAAETGKTSGAVALLKRLGIVGRALLIDVTTDEQLARSVRNLRGVALVPSRAVTARDVAAVRHVVATKRAIETLQEALS